MKRYYNQFVVVFTTCDGVDLLCTTSVICGLFDLFKLINNALFPYSDKYTVICLDDGIHYPFTLQPDSLRSLRQTLILKYCHSL